jgi:hypothetical protein
MKNPAMRIGVKLGKISSTICLLTAKHKYQNTNNKQIPIFNYSKLQTTALSE